MKVLHLVAGAGGMYCGSCLHGNTAVAALRRAGVDAVLLPLYTPLRTEGPDTSLPRVAMGGINVYLQQHVAPFRHTPWIVDRLFDWRPLLRLAARFGAATRPERLAALTVSMLRGEEGRQRKELEKLVQQIGTEIRPDLVHLNNALLAGAIRPLVRRLGLPVVCTLAGEDAFLARIPEPWQAEALGLLRERLAELAAAVAFNRDYAARAAALFGLDEQQVAVIPPGIELEKAEAPELGRFPGAAQRPDLAEHSDPQGGRGWNEVKPREVIRQGGRGWNEVKPREVMRQGGRGWNEVKPREVIRLQVPKIGFLARVCPDKGLDLLVEAAGLLAEDRGLPAFRLSAAGYLHPADRPYLKQIQRRAASCGLADRFEYVGELDAAGKAGFLASLDVFALPTRWPESKGLPVLEAWAAGVPVVVPGHGTFPEWIEQHRGGLLFAPDDAGELAAGLRRLLGDAALRRELGGQGWQAVRGEYHAQKMAERTLALYRRVLGDPNT